MMIEKIVWIYMALMCVIAFVVCGADKRRAITKKGRRVPEKTLFTLSAAGGAAGMFVGMLLFRHKTKHASFMFLVPLYIVIHAVVLLLLHKYSV